MPKTKEENRRIREEQRSNILEAAKRVLIRKGFPVTITDIAAEAKISQGLAYRYFDSKEAIFIELIKAHMDEIDPFGIKDPSIHTGTPTQRLYYLIDRLLDGSRRFIEIFSTAIQTYMEKPFANSLVSVIRKTFRHEKNGAAEAELLIEKGKEQFKVFRQLIYDIIVEGQSTGEFLAGDPTHLTVMILSSLNGIATLAIHKPEVFKKYYPYTGSIMRLVLGSRTPLPEEKNTPSSSDQSSDQTD